MTNLVDRFYAAMTVLAGDGHVKQRLIRAYQDNLAEIEDDELPLPAQEPFADLRRRMHAVAPLNGEGPIRASVRKMSCPEAGECGVLVVSLYGLLQKHGAEMPDEHVRASQDDAPVVPPFLVKSVS